MILSFKERFNEKILDGVKIHTIREDKHERWHEGREIHFANHIITPNYNQFHSGVCTGIQELAIYPDTELCLLTFNGNVLSQITPEILANNDGFDNVDDFWKWFDKPFEGRLIHWTDFRY